MNVEAYLISAVIAGTPLLFATLGEIMTEKVGNLNLGVEGMMLMGAVMGFQVGLLTDNPLLALLAAMLAGMFGALIYAFLTVTLRANQVVSGLTLTIFGTGFSSFIGDQLVGQSMTQGVKTFFRVLPIPLLSDIPFIGKIFFSQSFFVYLGYLAAVGLWFYLYHTRFGLNVRMIGENPAAADASGIQITRYKYIHILLGGLLCGLGGAFLSLVYIPAWQENVSAGRGWIAVALVIFAGWNPFLALIGAIFYGGLDILGLRLQAFDVHISQYLIDMLPYLMTIIVLVSASVRKSTKYSPPEGLSQPYFREDK